MGEHQEGPSFWRKGPTRRRSPSIPVVPTIPTWFHREAGQEAACEGLGGDPTGCGYGLSIHHAGLLLKAHLPEREPRLAAENSAIRLIRSSFATSSASTDGSRR